MGAGTVHFKGQRVDISGSIHQMEIITIALPSRVFGRTKLGNLTDSVFVSIKKNKEVWLGCLVLEARTLLGVGGGARREESCRLHLLLSL